ncbi:MAG: biopolymer transporter ExbD [Candidatus Cloacimonadota bacterium]|nr:biopolymer transporter ExbD [Candidatus Cloacimonadota bacterium]
MAYGPSKNRSRSQNEPREPNLIPIMNLFIVIIPMLMTIMVTVHLAMIEITLPTEAAGGGGGDEATEELEELPKIITLALLPDRFELMVEGIEEIITIPQLSVGTYDYFTLDQNIARLKENNENQGTIDLLPDPTVKFDTLLRSIDICKSNNFPNIKYLTSSTKYYKAK